MVLPLPLRLAPGEQASMGPEIILGKWSQIPLCKNVRDADASMGPEIILGKWFVDCRGDTPPHNRFNGARDNSREMGEYPVTYTHPDGPASMGPEIILGKWSIGR